MYCQTLRQFSENKQIEVTDFKLIANAAVQLIMPNVVAR